MVRIAVVEDDVGYRSSMVQMLKRYQKEKSGKTLLSWDCFENGMQIACAHGTGYNSTFHKILIVAIIAKTMTVRIAKNVLRYPVPVCARSQCAQTILQYH